MNIAETGSSLGELAIDQVPKAGPKMSKVTCRLPPVLGIIQGEGSPMAYIYVAMIALKLQYHKKAVTHLQGCESRGDSRAPPPPSFEYVGQASNIFQTAIRSLPLS